MNAIILSIGDELVLGQTIDTNSAWLSQQLAAVGCDILAHATVSDARDSIARAISQSAGACDYLIVSGGLGPTADDLTRQALADVLGTELELNADWLDQLREFFRQRNRPMPEANKIQAMIPRGAKMIWNHNGTAAGIEANVSTGPRACRVFVVPGVPKEMKLMFTRDVLPHISAAGGGAVILSRTLHTFGLGESSVAQMLGELMDRQRNPSVGTTVSGGVVSLRINARFENRAKAEAEMTATIGLCQAALGDLIYGQDEETLSQVVAYMLDSRGQTVATAESCTGGLLAKMITDNPGSSRYFQRGWITYSDQAKTDLLGVEPGTLQEHGAVSEPVVHEMARGARTRAGSTYALAISGVAGPDGGTAAKPVGMVCLALAHPEGIESRTFHFAGDREMVRDRSAKMALAMLRFAMMGKVLPF